MSKTRFRELRLALVCYGGVSLAIYMHGITKELHKLARASRAFDESIGAGLVNPFADRPDADSEFGYFEQLRDLAEQGEHLSVAVDIIAGTSAGGINGVCLAQVLSHDGSQEGLKSLWIDEGDLKELLKAPPIGGWRTRAALAGLALAVRPQTTRFPLRGDRMSRLLYDAISGMSGETGRTLVPAGGSLDLFVTTTDLHGFDVLVPSGAGGASQRDADHAQVLHFRYQSDSTPDDFTPEDVGSLAFAARATSCFPGAFPPVSVASFQTELHRDGQQRPLHGDRLPGRFRRQYAETGNRLEDAWFVDGGVLDNAPYDLVVDAIAAKRAEREVLRRVIYIQPDPGRPLQLLTPDTDHPAGTQGAPPWLGSVVTSLTSVKGSHSILRDLLRLRDLNRRIGQIGVIQTAQEDQVLRILDAADPVAAAGGGPSAPDAFDPSWADLEFEQVKQLAGRLNQAAHRMVCASYPTYCRLKLEAAGATLAGELAELFAYPPDSSHRSFVQAVITTWAQIQPAWQANDLDALGRLLGPIDVPYRRRRLQLILSAINALYDQVGTGASAPTAETLNGFKAQAWDRLEKLGQAPHTAAGKLDPSLSTFLTAGGLGAAAVYEDPADYARRHDAEITALVEAYASTLGALLDDSGKPIWEAFSTGTTNWAAEHRRFLLSRYLGYPLWDALIFPTIALSDLPQLTAIGVTQFSPISAAALTPPEQDKLKGTSFHHFGGFMNPAWRENDYLWGRLDGAELVLRTLRAAVDPTVPEPSTAGRLEQEAARRAAGPHLAATIDRILRSEADLRRVEKVRQHVADQIHSAGDDNSGHTLGPTARGAGGDIR